MKVTPTAVNTRASQPWIISHIFNVQLHPQQNGMNGLAAWEHNGSWQRPPEHIFNSPHCQSHGHTGTEIFKARAENSIPMHSRTKPLCKEKPFSA